MRELLEILDRIVKLRETGQPAALATVIATSGSTYRRPGARLLITESEAVGAVSAGCLEDAVIAVARRVLKTGQPQLMRFDTTEEMDKVAGTGLGCRGTIEVFIEPLQADESGARVYRQLRQALLQERLCQLAIDLKTARHALSVDEKLCLDELEDPQLLEAILRTSGSMPMQRRHAILQPRPDRALYLERIDPPVRLVIFGAGYDAIPLVQLAEQLGFRVTVVDHRPAYLTRERFANADQLLLAHPAELSQKIHFQPGSFVVIMTHNYLHDLEILKFALQSESPYIGQMGPRERTQELLAEIEQEIGPLSMERLARVHAPIGLDLGAETPEEIALSILSEILAVKNARSAGFLKERRAPIHSP